MVGKKYVSKDDLEAFARKLTRRVSGSSIHGGGNGGGGASDCFWTKVGNDIYYDDGIVGIRTMTDDVRDAELQWAVGAADVTKYTMGVDDSDSDAWLLCSGDILSSLVTPAVTGGIIYTYDGTILIEGGDNYLKLMRVSDGAFLDEIGGSGAGDGQFDRIRGICNDGTYAYVVEQGNDRLQKIRISDMTFVAKIGSWGSSNDQFNNPWKICSDGTYLYIVDSGNSRVVKRLCSDLSYDSKSSGTLNNPSNIAIDGTYLFVSQNSGAANRLVLMSAGDLSFLGAMADDGHIDNCTITEAIYKNGYLWLCNANIPGTLKTVYKYQVSLVAPYFAYVTHFLVGNSLVADEFYVGWSLDLDDTQIYLFNTRNSPGDPQEIYITTLSGTFVRRWGQYGTHDIDFIASIAISLVGTMSTPTLTPLRGPILKAGLDLSYCDSYPLFRARDGLQLMEDGTVGATDYVGLYAPAAITASYGLTFPGTGPSESSYFEVSAAGAISWAHVADLGSTHDHDAAYISIIGAPAANHFPYQTAGGELIDSGYAAGDFLTSVTAHDILSVTHGDAAAAAVVRGDIITGQGANPNTKWTRLALGAAGTYLAGSATEPVWATLNQAAIAGLTTADTVDFAAIHAATGLFDHIGEHTPGHTVTFDNTVVLATPVYKDINMAGYLMAKPASSAPGVDTFRSTGGVDTTIETYAFALNELVHGGFELQHDYKEGTDLVFHVHWQGIAAPAGGTDNVQWRLNYIVSRGGVTLAAAAAIDSPDTAIDTQYRCYRTDFAAIVGTTFKIGDQFMFTLTRVAATADDYAGDCLIETAGIHYQIDTLGSRAIASK